MRIDTKLKYALLLSALLPVLVVIAAHGDPAAPDFSGAAALGCSAALLIGLSAGGAVKLWLFGLGFKRVSAYTAAVKAGRFADLPVLPSQAPDGSENEFVEVYRSLDWMAHQVERRERELRDTIAALAVANDRLTARDRALREANGKLAAMARTDTLTGLYNRRYFFARLEQALRRGEPPLSVLLLDIDFFKRVNDTHGHQAGDLVLSGVAEVLLSSVRKTDVAARVGGEEFAVLLDGAAAEDARRLSLYIHERIRSREHPLPTGERLRITCSIGVISVEDSSLSATESVYRCADEALYAAKAGGRDRIVSYEPRATA